jgi:hypothetical protein
MLRARHICFLSAANPGIYSGGVGLESKFDTIKITPEAYRPAATLIKAGTPMSEVQQHIVKAGLSFPLIVKPDIGFRGLLVKKVQGVEELAEYFRRYPIDFILQEYVDWPEEAGVLYYRFPGEKSGHVSSITTKRFLSVEGDGQSTLWQLIERSPRALLQWARIKEQYAGQLKVVPTKGEKVPLGIVGNHAKGTQFFNSTHLANERVVATFDRIADQIEGFYYGRFDLKCKNLQALETGEGLRIIEINGVCSEPTHIYDPQRGTYWSALKAITKHWTVIFRIARANRKKGIRYLSHRVTARGFRQLFAYQRQLKEWSSQN